MPAIDHALTALRGLDRPALLALAALALSAAFFAVRPEVWRRLMFMPIDPRPVGLMRIAFGSVVLWNFLMLAPDARFLFSDDGLWLTDMARARYGAPLGAFGSLSVLHVRSDPTLVFALYAALLVAVVLMTVGAWTTWTTALSWLLVVQFYGYTPSALYGADRVIHVYLFLGMFTAWGEAYSVDSWRERRRAVLGTATELPARPEIAAWPVRLMMLQLAIIYCSSGLLKSGITWRDGTALYYVLNGDHLYRFPAQAAVTWLHAAGVLPLMTWLTRWWEMLFPLVLVGVALQGYERDRAEGRWPAVAPARRVGSWVVASAAWCAAAAIAAPGAARALSPGAETSTRWALTAALAVLPIVIVVLYRLLRRWPAGHHALLHWVLGRRVWLGFGVLFHLGIEAGTNLGTFPAVMLALYFAWLTGREVDGMLARLLGRTRARPVGVRYHPDERGVRRAALLRLLAPRACGAFVADSALPDGAIRVEHGSGAAPGLVGACTRWWLQTVGRL